MRPVRPASGAHLARKLVAWRPKDKFTKEGWER